MKPLQSIDRVLRDTWRGQEGAVALPRHSDQVSRLYRYGLIGVAWLWTLLRPDPIEALPVSSLLLVIFCLAHFGVSKANDRQAIVKGEYVLYAIRNAIGVLAVTAFLLTGTSDVHLGGIAALFLLPILEACFYFEKKSSRGVMVWSILAYAAYLTISILRVQAQPAAEVAVSGAIALALAALIRHAFLSFAIWYGATACLDREKRFRRRFASIAQIDLKTVGKGVRTAAEHIAGILSQQLDSAVDVWQVDRLEGDALQLTLICSSGTRVLEAGQVGRSLLPDEGNDGFVVRAAITGKPQAASNVDVWENYERIRAGTRSELAFPVELRGGGCFVFNLEASRPDGFTTRDVGFGEFLMDRVWSALNVTWLLQHGQELGEKLVAQKGRMDRLWRELVPMGVDVTFKDIATTAVRRAHEFLHELQIPLTLFVQSLENDDELHMLCWSTPDEQGQPSLYIPDLAEMESGRRGLIKKLGEGVAGRCAQLEVELYVADVREIPRIAEDEHGTKYQVDYLEFLEETRAEFDIPIRSDTELLGVLSVESPQRDVFTEELKEVCRAIAVAMAHAIANSKRYQQAVTEKRKLEQMGLSLVTAHDSQTAALESIMVDAQAYVDVDLAALFLRPMGADAEGAYVLSSLGDRQHLPELSYELGEGIIGTVAEAGVAELVHVSQRDASGESVFRPWMAEHLPDVTEWDLLAVPIKLDPDLAPEVGHSAVGVLALLRLRSDRLSVPFNDADQDEATAVAAHIAAFLYLRTLLDANHQHISYVQTQNQITGAIMSRAELGDQMQEMATVLQKVSSAQACLLYLYEKDKKTLTLSGSAGWDFGKTNIDAYHVGKDGDHLTVQAALGDAPLCRNDLKGHEGKFEETARSMFGSEGTHDFLGIPLRLGRRREGVAVFLNRDGGRGFQDSDIERIEALVPTLQLAITFARNVATLRSFRTEKQMRLVSKWARLYSHEIGNHIGVLQQIALLAQRSVEGGRSREYVDQIREEMRQLSKTHAVLGSLANLEVTPPQVVDLGEVTRSVVRRYEARADDAGVTLRSDCKGYAPALIQRHLFENAISNILLNGIQWAHGAVDRREVVVSLVKRHGDVEISVRDTGPGISSENMGRIFDAGFTTRPDEMGAGLGLSFAREIIQAQGGRVTVVSTPDAGATFTIRLPVVSEAAA